MFNENWGLVIFILLILGIVLGQSTLILIPLLILAVTLTSRLWNRFVLYRVTYERDFSEQRVFAGESVGLSISVANRKWLPVPWLQVEDLFPAEIELEERELPPAASPLKNLLTHVVSLGPRERVRWDYTLRCNQRGFYFFGPAQLLSGDVFGFFRQTRTLESIDRLIVYPSIMALPKLGFPGKAPLGESRAAQRIFEDPSRILGVREYHPEDSMRRVHWKATARQGELQVKVFEPTITQQLLIFLNIATFPQPWMGVNRARQEHIIRIAASTAFHATESKIAVGLIANGSVPHSDQPIKVQPGRSPDQLTHVLEALAAVTTFATSTIEDLLRAESPRQAWGATFVVISAVVTEKLVVEMLRLRNAGRRLALISTDPKFEGREIPGITVYHLATTELEFAGHWNGQPEVAIP